jgi:hypothetical protein
VNLYEKRDIAWSKYVQYHAEGKFDGATESYNNFIFWDRKIKEQEAEVVE